MTESIEYIVHFFAAINKQNWRLKLTGESNRNKFNLHVQKKRDHYDRYRIDHNEHSEPNLIVGCEHVIKKRISFIWTHYF